MKRVVLLVLLVVALGAVGCSPKFKIPRAYSPGVSNPAVSSPTFPVAISVVDHRLYVVSGEKDPKFVGVIRPSFGIPHDVYVRDSISLADDIKRDLSSDLRNAGLTVVENGGERIIEVSIDEYNFDCHNSCRIWHDLKVDIRNAQGDVLHSRVISHEQSTDRNILAGGVVPLMKNMPKIYTKMIQDLIRNDAEAMKVLARPEVPGQQ